MMNTAAWPLKRSGNRDWPEMTRIAHRLRIAQGWMSLIRKRPQVSNGEQAFEMAVAEQGTGQDTSELPQ
jgi:hypothetical protein